MEERRRQRSTTAAAGSPPRSRCVPLKREEPLSKRLRQDTYADGHRPSLPTGEEEVFAPARSPLLPGEKLEVTFYSDEAWIGSKRAESVTLKFQNDRVELRASFCDIKSLELTLDAIDPDVGIGLRLRRAYFPAGWKDMVVLRLARLLPEEYIHMVEFFKPDNKYDPQEACLCCMLLDPAEDHRPLQRELLALPMWKCKWTSVDDDDYDALTSGRRQHVAPAPSLAPLTQRQRVQAVRAADAVAAGRRDVGRLTLPVTPALPKLEAPVMWPPDDPDAVTLTNADLRRLAPGEFLNDTLVDFCIKQLREELPADQRARFHFFNSFLFKKLIQKPDADELSAVSGSGVDSGLTLAELAAHGRVRRWTSKVDVFSKEFLVLPVNQHLHWTLAIMCNVGAAPAALTVQAETVIELVDDSDGEDQATNLSTPSPCILQLNSLGDSHANVESVLRAWLACEWAHRKGHTLKEGVRAFGVGGPLRFVRCSVPQQPNSFDCGLFTTEFARRFCMHAPRPHLSLDPRHGWPYMLTPSWFPPEAAGARKRQRIHRHILAIAGVLPAPPAENTVDLTV